MDKEKIEKEIYFATSIIGDIKHVDAPILKYKEEKDVVKKALTLYISELENELRGK